MSMQRLKITVNEEISGKINAFIQHLQKDETFMKDLKVHFEEEVPVTYVFRVLLLLGLSELRQAKDIRQPKGPAPHNIEYSLSLPLWFLNELDNEAKHRSMNRVTLIRACLEKALPFYVYK